MALLVHLTLLWTLTPHSKPPQERDVAVEMVFTPPAKPAALQPPPPETPLEAPPDMTAAPLPLPSEQDGLSTPLLKHLQVSRRSASASAPLRRPTIVPGATTAASQGEAVGKASSAETATGSKIQNKPATPAASVSQAPGCRAITPAYPASARIMRETGTASVILRVAPGGSVTAAQLEQSSGYDDLDDVAVSAAHAAHCTNPTGVEGQFRLPVHFRFGASAVGAP